MPPLEAALLGAQGDRLHRAVDQHLAGRRVHPDPADGRDRRAAVPRVRGDALGRDRRLDGRLADDDADDVRHACSSARAADEHGRFYRLSERVFDADPRAATSASLGWVLRHPLSCCSSRSRRSADRLPRSSSSQGFFPQQDTGRLSGIIQADQDTSFQAMEQLLSAVRRDRRRRSGGRERDRLHRRRRRRRTRRACSSRSSRWRSAKDQRRRGHRAAARPSWPASPGATLFLQAVQDSASAAAPSNAQYQYTLQGDDLARAERRGRRRCWPKLRKLPGLVDVNSDQQNHGLQAALVIDRDTASRFGVTPQAIDDTLYDAFGQRQVSTMYTPLNQYHVVMEVAPQFWQRPRRPEAHLRPRPPDGAQVPLERLRARTSRRPTPLVGQPPGRSSRR